MVCNNNYHKGHKKPYQITSESLGGLDLEELRARWERDTKIISRIVQLENELGRPLTMLDLFCRFDKWDLDSVSYALHWLVVERDVPF
jgi:hypothetical protein